jgi:hypothetical protein
MSRLRPLRLVPCSLLLQAKLLYQAISVALLARWSIISHLDKTEILSSVVRPFLARRRTSCVASMGGLLGFTSRHPLESEFVGSYQ